MGNGQDVFTRLRQPFDDGTVKWKIQTNPKENDTFALCVAYIDARDVSARLNEVVGIAWSSSFGEVITLSRGQKAEQGVECRLTVLGHTRVDIGTLPANEPLKGGYSDALKRAAVHFGIAAYVYAFPKVWAEVKQAGRSYYFTDNAKRELMELVTCIHASAPKLPTFRALKVRDYTPINFALTYYGGVDEEPEEEPPVAPLLAPGRVPTHCADCGQAIADYYKLSATEVAERNLQRYGRALCAWCAQKAKKMDDWLALFDAAVALGVIADGDSHEWPGEAAPLQTLNAWEQVTTERVNRRFKELSAQSGIPDDASRSLSERVKTGLEMMEAITTADEPAF